MSVSEEESPSFRSGRMSKHTPNNRKVKLFPTFSSKSVKIKAEKPTTVAIFPTIASPPRMLAIRLVIELLYPNKSSQYLS